MIETVQAGKVTLTLAHGCRLTFVDVDGNPRTIDGEPAVIRMFRAMQHGSGKLVQTVREEGREKPTNCTGPTIYASPTMRGTS